MGLLDFPIRMVLNKVRDKVLNPPLDGIGVIEELRYKNRKLYIKIRLDGLEDHPVEIECSEIVISPDASSIRIDKFLSNKQFAQTLLQRFVEGKTFPLPEKAPKSVILAAKTILGL